MAINLTRPGDAPDWFTFFLNALRSILNRLDQDPVKFLRYDFDYNNNGATLSLARPIPANAVVDYSSSGLWVFEAFNAGTKNKLDIGTAATTNLYANQLDLTTLGFKALNQGAVLLRPDQSAATELKFKVDTTGVAPTTGKGSVIVKYMVPQGG